MSTLTRDTTKMADPAAASRPAGGRSEWFPTAIWRFTVAAALTLNAQLLALIAAERAHDPAGLSRSTVLGWHSQDQLHQRPDLHAFVALLHQAIAEVGRDYRLDPQQARLDLATCWAIVNGPGASSVVHCHPNAFVSGVYYVHRWGPTVATSFFRTRVRPPEWRRVR